MGNSNNQMKLLIVAVLCVVAVQSAQLTSANAAAGGTAVFGMSPFMDVPADEFAASHLMPKGVLEATLTSNAFLARGGEAAIPTQSPPLGTTLPKSFDWRDSNTPVITPVKNQGQCGSCWAFSVTEEVESMWALAGHPLIELAPQQIVDCDTEDDGCNGGDTRSGYAYVIKAGGLVPEKDYPYTD